MTKVKIDRLMFGEVDISTKSGRTTLATLGLVDGSVLRAVARGQGGVKGVKKSTLTKAAIIEDKKYQVIENAKKHNISKFNEVTKLSMDPELLVLLAFGPKLS